MWIKTVRTVKQQQLVEQLVFFWHFEQNHEDLPSTASRALVCLLWLCVTSTKYFNFFHNLNQSRQNKSRKKNNFLFVNYVSHKFGKLSTFEPSAFFCLWWTFFFVDLFCTSWLRQHKILFFSLKTKSSGKCCDPALNFWTLLLTPITCLNKCSALQQLKHMHHTKSRLLHFVWRI